MNAGSPQNCLVIGAGISGLATAIALAQQNVSVRIIEKRKDFSEYGAGIQLGPNAIHCLSALGLTSFLEQQIISPNALILSNLVSGTQLGKLNLGQNIQDKFGAPYWVMSRKILHDALLHRAQQLPQIILENEAELLASDEVNDGYQVTTIHQKKLSKKSKTHALIGADGVFSNFRQRLFPHKNPKFSGYIAWRGIIPKGLVPASFNQNQVHLAFGKGCHLVGYPIDKFSNYNLVVVTRGEYQKGDKLECIKAITLQAKLGQVSEHFATLVNACASWSAWPLYANLNWDLKLFEPLKAQTLTGDAAHPLLPFLAQGAALSLEDAVILGQCFAQNNKENTAKNIFESTFRSYEKARHQRWLQVTQAAQKNHFPYHAPFPISVARDLVIRAHSSEALLRKYDWLYSWRPY